MPWPAGTTNAATCSTWCGGPPGGATNVTIGCAFKGRKGLNREWVTFDTANATHAPGERSNDDRQRAGSHSFLPFELKGNPDPAVRRNETEAGPKRGEAVVAVSAQCDRADRHMVGGHLSFEYRGPWYFARI